MTDQAPLFVKLDSAGEATWIDVDLQDATQREWILSDAKLSKHVQDHLLESVKMTRRESINGGLLVSLLGFRIGEKGSVSNELNSVRIWIEESRIITVRSGPNAAVDELRKIVSVEEGPSSVFELLAFFVTSHIKRLESQISDISLKTDSFEEQILAQKSEPRMDDLNSLRRETLRLRRQLVPVRGILRLMLSDQALNLGDSQKRPLSTAAEHIGEYLENLEDCRERADLLRDQMEAQLSTMMTRVTYNLTVVATIFLPLSFITGLLGINVAGIPEGHNPVGFWIVCAFLVAVAFVTWWAMRWRRWV
jgi:zinc transporter